MLKYVFAGLGWLLLVSAIFNIVVRLFGSDESVLRYAGSSRDLDLGIMIFFIGLVFLGISSIMGKLDKILQDGKS